jgi:hypothetical protein
MVVTEMPVGIPALMEIPIVGMVVEPEAGYYAHPTFRMPAITIAVAYHISRCALRARRHCAGGNRSAKCGTENNLFDTHCQVSMRIDPPFVRPNGSVIRLVPAKKSATPEGAALWLLQA